MHDAKWVHDGASGWDRLCCSGVVAGEAVHGHQPAHGPIHLLTGLEPVGEHLRRTTRDHVKQAGWTNAVHHGCEVHQHSHERRATVAADVLPYVLINPEDPDTV